MFINIEIFKYGSLFLTAMISEKQMKHILKLAKINKERYKKYGHNLLGFKHKEETKKRIAIKQMGDKNPMWKGDDVGYLALHEWIRKNKPKPKFCEICKVKPPIDLANISKKYKRDINDFEWICRRCHMKKDGRLKRLHRKKIKKIKEKCKSCGNWEIYNIKGYCKKCYYKEYQKEKRRKQKCVQSVNFVKK